jgi:hypothetical protein
MSIEAMKQAREALALLDYLWYQSAHMNPKVVERKMYAAMSTLGTAIEQAEQQEPVAFKWKGELFTPGEIEMLDVDDAVPLYQNPQLVECMCGICKLGKREWVGLTEEEIKSLYDKYATYQEYDAWESGWFEFAGAFETMLKERNHAVS